MDLLKDADTLVFEKLVKLFNICLKQSKVLDEWNCAITILLYNKSNPKNLGNYRPISLLNCFYKIFTRVLTKRITKTLDENQPREQAGFRKGYSTIYHLHSVNQLIEKSDEYKIPLAMAFVDYQKAFDSVDIHKVLESIKNQGVEPVYVNILNYIYQNGTSFIRLHKDSNPFPLQKGVRQGDTILSQAVHSLSRISLSKP